MFCRTNVKEPPGGKNGNRDTWPSLHFAKLHLQRRQVLIEILKVHILICFFQLQLSQFVWIVLLFTDWISQSKCSDKKWTNFMLHTRWKTSWDKLFGLYSKGLYFPANFMSLFFCFFSFKEGNLENVSSVECQSEEDRYLLGLECLKKSRTLPFKSCIDHEFVNNLVVECQPYFATFNSNPVQCNCCSHK